jgi:type II secretory pathway pseudopilin PulG
VPLTDERGYSLIEAVMVMAMLTLVIAAITTLFASGTNAQGQLNQRFQAQHSARFAFDQLRRDTVCASSASGSATSVSLIVHTGCISAGLVTWCTAQVSTGRHQLFRLAGSGTCATNGRLFADWLTTGDIFTRQGPSDTSLAKVRIDVPIQLTDMEVPYRLCNVFVLRNSEREGAPVTQVASC